MMVVIRSSLTRIFRTKWLQYVKDSALLQFKHNCVAKLVCILITFKKYYSFRYVTNEYMHMLAFTADL